VDDGLEDDALSSDSLRGRAIGIGVAAGGGKRGGGAAEGAQHSKGCQNFLFHLKPPFMARPTPRRGYVA
jgi:hypothetical protein